MNNNEIERMLLLNQSGELSAKERKHLSALLATDPSVREQAEELENLRDAWQQAAVDTPSPSLTVLERIRQVAADSAQKRKSATLIWFRLPAVGIAAAAMIAIGASLYLTVGSPKAPPPTQMAQMDPVDLQIEAALEAIDTSMLALLDVPTDDILPGNDS